MSGDHDGLTVPIKPAAPIKLLVVGGGFTGTAFIIHALRAAERPLDIIVVEPAAELGRGIAYGTDDAAHRINVPSERMGLFRDDPNQATRWFQEHDVLPDAASEDGQGHFFVARHAYGSFVADVLQRTLASAAGRVTFRHWRTMACAVRRRASRWEVDLADGRTVGADLVALCFGHAVPLLPCAVDEAVKRDPKFVPDPWAGRALAGLAPSDAVLVVGTGLTMADVVVSLRESGHAGPITAVSRRGLLPRGHGLFRGDVDLLEGQTPPATALGLLQLLRRRIRRDGEALGGWHPIVDALRANLPLLWNSLPRHEKARALRRLLPFWEVHRFRIAPQVAAALEESRAGGTLRVDQAGLVGLARRRGRIAATLRHPAGDTRERDFDAVILCTGPEKDLRRNPLVAALLAGGVARLDDLGLGLAVDMQSHVLDRDGHPWPTLLAFGPITRGSFGEMTGAPDITQHIERVAGGLFAAIEGGNA